MLNEANENVPKEVKESNDTQSSSVCSPMFAVQTGLSSTATRFLISTNKQNNGRGSSNNTNTNSNNNERNTRNENRMVEDVEDEKSGNIRDVESVAQSTQSNHNHNHRNTRNNQQQILQSHQTGDNNDRGLSHEYNKNNVCLRKYIIAYTTRIIYIVPFTPSIIKKINRQTLKSQLMMKKSTIKDKMNRSMIPMYVLYVFCRVCLQTM